MSEVSEYMDRYMLQMYSNKLINEINTKLDNTSLVIDGNTLIAYLIGSNKEYIVSGDNENIVYKGISITDMPFAINNNYSISKTSNNTVVINKTNSNYATLDSLHSLKSVMLIKTIVVNVLILLVGIWMYSRYNRRTNKNILREINSFI